MWEIREGDVLKRLAEIQTESVQCVVTSPPYWGLRDYGTAKWEGGDSGCDHSPEKRGGRFASPVSSKQASNTGSGTASTRECSCGARRIDSQIGLEPTPEQYVAKMVEVFREVRRVLRQDGTLWLNLGDSYAASRGNGASGIGEKQATNIGANLGRLICPPDLKPKDLCGIPWRVAFALQADGWYLRSDIIWAKPNPMPESVTDRPTKAHEYLFLLAKSPRYYFDAEAVREDGAGRLDLGRMKRPEARLGEGGKWADDCGFKEEAGRNIRTVWTIATQPFPEAHFATFPEKLVEPCIKAGSKPGDLVLDPFVGSGTVGVVALRLARSFLGIELNPKYSEMARNRIYDDAPLLNQATQ